MAIREPYSSGLGRVVERGVALCSASERDLATAFIPEFLGEIDDDELLRLDADELAVTALAHLQLGRVRLPGQTLVKVAVAGASARSVLLVVTDDAPFLVDTIRLALERRGMSIHLMVHPMLDVERSPQGVLVGLAAGAPREAWTQMNIDRCPDAAVAALETEITAAVAMVHLAVDDVEAMRLRAQQVADHLAGANGANSGGAHTAAESEQVSKLLEWLVRQHFVFLGAASYSTHDGGLRVTPGSQLGLLRAVDTVDPMFAGGEQLVSIARADSEVDVHRHARPVCVAVRRFSDSGAVAGEERFMGLFSAAAYRAEASTIPLIRERVAWVLGRSKVDPASHTGRALRTVLETFPRDELFEIGRDELAEVAADIVALQDRSLVRVLELRSPASGWQTLAVYLPRIRLTPEMPERVAQRIAAATRAERVEFDTYVGTGALARITVQIRRGEAVTPAELERLSAEIDQFTQRWDDQLRAALTNAVGEQRGMQLAHRYLSQLSREYTSITPVDLAVLDVQHIDALLSGGDATATAFVSLPQLAPNERRFRLYRRNSPLTLAELLPYLDQLGLQAIDERPFTLQVDGDTVSLYDVGVRLPEKATLTDAIVDELQSTFRQLLTGQVESDGFNRLVLAAGLTARDVEIVRTYARYLRQTTFPFSQQYIEGTLVRYPGVAQRLVALFHERFHPASTKRPAAERDAAVATIRAELNAELAAIPSLDEDRICRTLVDLVAATLRTNAFRPSADGGLRPVIALKLEPAKVLDLPLPRPMFEIWVCSPRVEGVHLRGGRIARGGIRWSDRREDFRTEVLGLMKAQMVKNAVIVPVGAKGGFVVKHPPGDAESLRSEVVGCYREFIAGLLDLTDNIVGGHLQPPPDTVRYDDDDPYLVVAADKGTASFSDIANQISASYNFWLGDAFASGGSVGYDHKMMGITAHGAWESVRRHAQVLGRNADTDPLTVVGVGDMSGDVFGNGLLCSPHVKLLAAFDHRHVFLDPDPDGQQSFEERKRLFGLERSSWADYNTAFISAGGGVFARSDKSIPLSAQVRQRLGVDQAEMAPNQLIAALLRAPVDLLWNGGIGTYVKAATESHADVGDRANDGVRVNGAELRCRMVGEGGNLGFTQRGRVEYALAGGLINTDAIDNSAGVDCSDHEVNIKILLNGCVQRGELTLEARNALLAEMTDEVGELVLDDNRAQTLALAIARRQSVAMVNVHTRYLQALETEGWLNRSLEFLPTDRQIAERQAAGQGLTTPEFSVLLAYTKNANVAELHQSDLPDDPFLRDDLLSYFPRPMRERFATEILDHQLRREIVATAVVNQMVNLSGISFDHRMTEQTGAGTADIVRAWVAAREVTQLPQLWEEIGALDGGVKLDVQLDLLLEARQMTERSVLWLLRHRRPPIDLAATISDLAVPMRALSQHYDEFLRGQMAAMTHSAWAGRLAAGVPDSLAERSSVWPLLHTAFDVIDIAARHDHAPRAVASMYWHLFEALDVLWLWEGIGALSRSTRWETQARSALRDDLLMALADLTGDVLRAGADVETWLGQNERSVARVTAMFNDVRRSDTFDITTLTVGLRQLRNLALATS
ncbi:unannotated protein [freshwater metagenome]|uniref:Unannotated protein n=1 Tax=freshwater metagenome TaxID=449393 RepID=A0A6J7FMY7_9ZZZZ|nr:NAD-glutamate dehydrogenase [Actinomycetota bacterium]